MSTVPLCTRPGFDDASGRKFYNSLGQSPCYIATVLENVCNAGNTTWNLPPLTGGGFYIITAANSSDTCQCSTVHYSMLSACSYCQTLNFTSWPNYSKPCISAAISLSMFPHPIPAGIAIPHYAYLDVVTGGSFNVNAALAAGGAESSSISNATSAKATASTGLSATSALTTSAPSTGSATQPTGTANDSPSSTNGKSNTGIVIAGTIGGVAVLILLGWFSIWLFRFCHKRPILVHKLPSEHSLISAEPHSMRSADQYSLRSSEQHSLRNAEQYSPRSAEQYSLGGAGQHRKLSADEYSLLGPPTRPAPLMLSPEDDEYLVDTTVHY